jgi:hypothetical protein
MKALLPTFSLQHLAKSLFLLAKLLMTTETASLQAQSFALKRLLSTLAKSVFSVRSILTLKLKSAGIAMAAIVLIEKRTHAKRQRLRYRTLEREWDP